jgi:hypothetical protein
MHATLSSWVLRSNSSGICIQEPSVSSCFAIASMLPSPISSIHLLNSASSFLLSSVKLCDESRLFNVSWSTVTCNHKGELTIAKPVISAREPPCTIGKVCLRSPPKTTTFPPKGNLLYRDYGIKTISWSVLSKASKVILCVIKASSHMIRDAACINSQSIVPHFIFHVVPSTNSSQGILKREWVVRPPVRGKEATPDDATDRTIFLCPQRYVIIVFHRKVFPVPPYPETKKNPALFAKTVSTIASKRMSLLVVELSCQSLSLTHKGSCIIV